MSNLFIFFLACLVASSIAANPGRGNANVVEACQDAPDFHCHPKDGICDSAIDAAAYCPRFCGLCEGKEI